MVGGESDSIARICCKIKSTMHDFPSPFFERHKVPRDICAREISFLISDLFYMRKMFEQTVESELEDSLGEYGTAAESNSRDRRSDSVRGVICDATYMK